MAKRRGISGEISQIGYRERVKEESYPPDEFDRIAKNLPQGAHRPGQPWWRGFLPFVIVIIAAPLLAWATLLLIGSNPMGPGGSAPTATVTKTATPNTSPTKLASTPAATPTQTQAPEPKETPLDKSSAVSVLNASGIGGLAARTKDKVAAQGYSRVTATNFSGAKPAQNTIYYPADKSGEAKDIQQILRIDMIVERAGITEIQVVLVSNL